MQSYMSGAPAPAVQPLPSVTRPEVVQPQPHKPRSSGPWIVLLIVIGLIVAGALVWQKVRTANAPAAPAKVAVRSATVIAGPVERSIRVTGVTAAANYASLVTPRLRGSRSDHGRDSSSSGGGGSSPASTSSSSASNSSASSASSSSAPNASSAFKAATGRLGGSTLRGSVASSSSPSSSSPAAASSSSAMGPAGLGSTASQLPGGGGGGGGGGGMSDFMLVLQQVAPAGTMVRKGDQVAEFDRQYMLLRLDDYRASVIQSEAALKKRKADLEASHKAHDQLITAAKGEMERARLDLKTIPVLSTLDAEKVRLAFQQAQAKYQQLLKEVPFVLASEEADTKIAEFDLQEAKLELRRAEMNADRMIVKAPIDGLVVMQNTFRGGEFGQIQQGDQLWPGQFYMQIVDPRSMVIEATVNQTDVEHIHIGQKARVHFDAYPDLVLPAHIASVGAVTKPGGFRAQFVKEVPIRLKIDKMDRRVIPDLSVSAHVIIDSDQHAAAVAPLGAVFHDDSAVSAFSKAYVYVRDAVGWTRRDVELGLRNNLVAVIKSGLRPGDVVALDRPVEAQVSP